MMVGRPMDAEFPPHEPRTGKIKLRVEGLCLGDEVQDVSFIARQGEILGFAGLVGAGRTETMRLLFGADRPDSGRILIDEHEVSIRDPREAISRGICLLSEDRKAEGLILGMSSRENFALPTLKRLTKGLFVDQHREAERFEDYKNNLNIKLTDPEAPVLNLSGGNQQKVVLAKWLEANADIVIFDEPTRGIDVGAKYEIYLLIKNLAEEGKCIIIVSSELPELLGLCDRIIVMHEGVIKGEILEPASYSQEDILDMAIS